MNKCIMCGAEVFKDIGYVTDGKIFVCDRCAESHSLTRIMTRIENSEYDTNLMSCYVTPIETGLVDQTEQEESDEFTKPQGYRENCPLSPCDSCNFYYDEINKCMAGEPGHNPTEEERDKVSSALGEEEAANFFAVNPEVQLVHDIDNMSHDDFFSKYADNPEALHSYILANGEPASVLNV